MRASCGDAVTSPVRGNDTMFVLKTAQTGKFIMIKMIDDTLMLCAEDLQNAKEKGTADY